MKSASHALLGDASRLTLEKPLQCFRRVVYACEQVFNQAEPVPRQFIDSLDPAFVLSHQH